MAIDRRHFLGAAGGLAAWLAAGPGLAGAPRMLWLAANTDAARQNTLGAFDESGACVFEVELPARGHGIAVAPHGRTCVVVARRPGTFAAVVDLARGNAVRWLEAPADRHFHGHGAFSADGMLFYSSENAFASGEGIIGIWDAADGFRRLGEMSSHGVEPHDIRLLPDGRTLVVANGGLRTHPASGRARLNLDDMDSSLVHLDARDGRLVGQWRLTPDLKLLSIRHLAVGRHGAVAIGLQYQGEGGEVPIVGLHRPGQGIGLLDLPAGLAAGLQNYCGSVGMDADGAVFAASCPKGNCITLWQTASGRYLGAVEVPDGCGVAAGSEAGSILMTSGGGGAWLWRQDGSSRRLQGSYLAERRWDNHAASVRRPPSAGSEAID